MSQASEGSDALHLGPFAVRADPERSESFDAIVGAPQPSAANMVFPIAWLTLPEIKEAARAMAGADFLPVHESQAFEYFHPLDIGADYDLRVAMTRETGPDRLIVTGEVFDQHNRRVLIMRATLRLFAIPPESAGARKN